MEEEKQEVVNETAPESMNPGYTQEEEKKPENTEENVAENSENTSDSDADQSAE